MGSIFGQSVNLNEAKVGGGGIYFLPLKIQTPEGEVPEYATARYLVSVDTIKIFKSRAKVDFFLAEFTILESNNPARPAKTRCNFMMDLTKDAAPGNIKALLCALNGFDPNGSKDAEAIAGEDWDAVAETAVSDDNPLKGDKVVIECFYRLKKNQKPSGGDKAFDKAYYTHHVFLPTSDEIKK